MVTRLLAQYFTLAISLFIIAVAVAGMCLRPDKRWTLLAWVLYGAVNAAFYVLVLCLGAGDLGNELSPIRVLIKDTLVASLLLSASLPDLQEWWVKRWRS